MTTPNTPIDDGGPAFPVFVPVFGDPPLPQPQHMVPGMSLRDYFAAHATDKDVEMAVDRLSSTLPKHRNEITVGEARYNHADAMLAARKAVQS